MLGIMLNDISSAGVTLLKGEKVLLSYQGQGIYNACPERRFGYSVPVHEKDVHFISYDESRAEEITAWNYAIWKFGEEGLWLVRKADRVVVYKYGVLKETI